MCGSINSIDNKSTISTVSHVCSQQPTRRILFWWNLLGNLEPQKELFCADADESKGYIDSIDAEFLAEASVDFFDECVMRKSIWFPRGGGEHCMLKSEVLKLNIAQLLLLRYTSSTKSKQLGNDSSLLYSIGMKKGPTKYKDTVIKYWSVCLHNKVT
jgi:hypothetical protein